MRRYKNLAVQKYHEFSVESIALLLWLSLGFALSAFKFITSRLGFSGLSRNIILFGITLIPFLYLIINIRKIDRKKFIPFIVLFLTIGLAFLVTYLIHPEYQYFFTRSDYGMPRVFKLNGALYAFLFFSLISDSKELKKIIKIYAYISMASLVVFSMIPAILNNGWVDVNHVGEMVKRRYSLSFGYSMTLPTIIFLYFFIIQKRIHYLVFSVLGLISIFTMGSRGPLLIIILFIMLMVLRGIVDAEGREGRISKIKSILKIFAIGLLALLLIYYFIIPIIPTIEIKSRTLQMLLSGDLTKGNGREVIWSSVFENAKDHWVFGLGVFGDRPIVFPLNYAGYAHNILLELFISFGVLGIAVIVIIFVHFIYMMFYCQDKSLRDMYLIFFAVACQLLLSMSFWYVFEFWAAFALVFKARQMESRNKGLLNFFHKSSLVKGK